MALDFDEYPKWKTLPTREQQKAGWDSIREDSGAPAWFLAWQDSYQLLDRVMEHPEFSEAINLTNVSPAPVAWRKSRVGRHGLLQICIQYPAPGNYVLASALQEE